MISLTLLILAFARAAPRGRTNSAGALGACGPSARRAGEQGDPPRCGGHQLDGEQSHA